ncbi:shikimate dehydrogenase [Frigidibacter albus]|uniref:Shikimate dehydrogenase n=1 Tax=Frigidibacter albus TaxID=1465486 RepID=A0A6L8VN18_9RHOB|nr:shikimate dehydrogenase [Frigidibacter albus]MZQ90550.1 shikimate dehydrogenase [Frigidibacter albus]NBE32330.1 shikimate dehydrogenase [Frigidibacter albus]GGH59205.1 shikimate dehydrogenase [Frigidibacter albus]
MTDTIRLGLIGDNIAKSQSPRLHRLAGAQNGRRTTYDPLVPAEMDKAFDAVFAHVAASGYRGVNVTYPYKERAAAKVVIDDPLVRAIGAVNTVVFDEGGPHGFNTDYSGFIAAYRRVRGDAAPGPVLMIGAGGVGKAVAFGLVALGLDEIRIVDRDLPKAEALAAALTAASPGLVTRTGTEAAVLATGAGGIINCTPVGMVGYDGTPLPRAALAGADWVFDAVYTPVDTQFLQDAAAEGLQVISGYELFFGQGVDAWAIFTGLPLDEARMRRELAEGKDVT